MNSPPLLRSPAPWLLYGSGLRLMECVRLRVQDMDFEYRTITVRDGRGEKDRIVPLPETVIPELRRQIERVRLLHQEDLAAGCGKVYLTPPPALRATPSSLLTKQEGGGGAAKPLGVG